jgi:methylmalonyl-CoA mutase
VFLANLGPVAAFTARSTFAKNFFEAGGVEAVTNDGFQDVSALVEAWRGSGARLVCLCSSDEIYREQAVDAAKALAEAGAATLYLAGRPGDLQEPLAQVGVTRHIFAGCDALAVLQEASSLA